MAAKDANKEFGNVPKKTGSGKKPVSKEMNRELNGQMHAHDDGSPRSEQFLVNGKWGRKKTIK